MITIFIDEAGDLGFKRGSQTFIFSMIITKNPEFIRRCMRKSRDTIPKSKHKPKELHWNNTGKDTKIRTLKKLKNCDFETYILVIDKSSIHQNLHTIKDRLYHYLAGLIVEEARLDEKEVSIVFDKRSKNKKVRTDLSTYILNKIFDIKSSVRAKVTHERSEDEKGLQAADFVCGAAFSKYERNNSSYLEIIREKIVMEKRRFEKK